MPIPSSALVIVASTMNVPGRAPPPPPPAPPMWEIVEPAIPVNGRYSFHLLQHHILKTFLYYNVSPVRTHTMHLTHSQEIVFVGDPDIYGFNNYRSPIHGFHNWVPDCERWTAEFHHDGNMGRLRCITFIKDPNEAGITSYRGYLSSEIEHNFLFSPTRRIQPWCLAVQSDLVEPEEGLWL